MTSAAAFDIVESTDADALLKRAQALEAAGKYDDAGAAYQSAGDAFKIAGRNTEWSSALRKSAEMYEKEADQLTNGGTPAKAAPPATRAVTRPKEAALSPVRAHSVRLPPLSPRPGYIIGRAITEDGRLIAHFQVSATGFDGQVNLLAGSPSLGAAEGRAGRYALQTMDTFRHVKPVSATVMGVRALATIEFRGKTYVLEMHPIDGKVNGSDPTSFRGNSGRGVVRDFILNMSGLRPGYAPVESTETTHRLAHYGGVLRVECSYSQGKYANIEDATSLTKVYPSGSALEVTLTPVGPLLDGSQGAVITQTVHMTHLWRDAYLRGIPFGVYATTARLIEPNGTSHKLRLQLDGPKATWEPSVVVEWVPAAWDASHETMTQPTLHLGQ